MEQIQEIGSNRGINSPTRRSEVSQEMDRLQMNAEELDKLSQELIQRLSSVLSPKQENPNKETQDLSPSTPLASNMHALGNKLLVVEKGLRFILEGLEL